MRDSLSTESTYRHEKPNQDAITAENAESAEGLCPWVLNSVSSVVFENLFIHIFWNRCTSCLPSFSAYSRASPYLSNFSLSEREKTINSFFFSCCKVSS